jgi:hypothetical protein
MVRLYSQNPGIRFSFLHLIFLGNRLLPCLLRIPMVFLLHLMFAMATTGTLLA